MDVTFPNELLVALKENPDSFRRKVLILWANCMKQVKYPVDLVLNC